MVRVRVQVAGQQVELACPKREAAHFRARLLSCETAARLFREADRCRAELRVVRAPALGRKQRRNSQKRWHCCPLVRRAPHNLLASTGRPRIFVSAVVRHSNIGQCAEKGLLSVALCHSTLRSCMEVGDVALLISCSRQTPKVEPHVYKEALDGNRRLVSVFRVTERLSPAEYHTQFGERTDSWYRKSRKGDTVRWLADGTELSER